MNFTSKMSTTAEPTMLSRSGVFHRLGSLLSDVSSMNSSDIPTPLIPDRATATNDDIICFDTLFANLAYKQDSLTIEHIHLRCHPASSFDASIHTSLCEAVLGIFPDTSSSMSSSSLNQPPVIVRGVIERRHRRIKVGDWLLAINSTDVNWINLNDILSKCRSNRKVRLKIRHPCGYKSTFTSSIQPPITLPLLEEKKISIPEQIECIHSVLYYEKRPTQGFKLLYQHPAQKDIFFAAGGVFPVLAQLMRDMNEHDSVLRRYANYIEMKRQTIKEND